ncbi:hypothetical protein PP761_gp08 [Stenotrophomonas phage Paxi]|uniref:Uncharacterized protein n=1 Tax=Stenotrophomonas phage Paxi TaxID=2859653 RepID=A0AAE8BHR3_9CAUD|nr:hypothetical protein PP761_gp08 [Stenotrophomonas phage Paxi]QYW01779.1 hypothetical protein CPT_Paxi_008 [Stenotrophomonas phage Paxi]
MTIKHNGKPGVPQSYKDTTERLAAIGQFNLPVKSGHSKLKKRK